MALGDDFLVFLLLKGESELMMIDRGLRDLGGEIN